MTDVRLTALNPVDSQVYPVACNTSGELLVAGDGTEYLPLTGGDLTGNLTFNTDKITLIASNGRINAARADIGDDTSGYPGTPLSVYSTSSASNQGTIQAKNFGTGGANFIGFNSSGSPTCTLLANGSATFSGSITASGSVTAQDATINNNFRVNNNLAVFAAAGNIYEGYSTSTGSNVNTFSVNADGSGFYAGTLTATVVPPSDARFKENIEPAKPQLADVVALGGILKNYNWNTEAPVNDEIRAQRQLGLIAQEAAEVCPSLVKELGSEDNRYKGIPMEALIMKLIGAVSELKTELDQMKIT